MVLLATSGYSRRAMRPKMWLLMVAGTLLSAACSNSETRPDADEMWRRAQLVFAALRIDAVTNEWTGPDKLNEEFGFVCWMDGWPDGYPAYLNVEELAAMAVIACPSLSGDEVVKAIAYIGNVDEQTAQALIDQANESLKD